MVVTMYEYSRSAASAISEFAPMNSFYVDGRKLTIDQVDLTTAQTELCSMVWDLLRTKKEKPAAGKTGYWRTFWKR